MLPAQTTAESASRNQQAEWLQPAAWSVENASVEYPFSDAGEAGAGSLGKLLIAGFSRIGFASFLVLFLLGVISAELVTAYRSHILGQAYHGALFILILLYVMFSRGAKNQKLLLALGLVPLIRLISLTMPSGGYWPIL